MGRSVLTVLAAVVLVAGVASAQTKPSPKGPPTKVSFRDDGTAVVNGRPFFPIGIWMYELNGPFLADVHEHRFNTVIGNGFSPDQLDLLADHGLMAVPIFTEEFFQKGVNHPSLLAWYLRDEPEGRETPEKVAESYKKLKARDPNHPIGLDHFLWEGLTQYKDGADFTMTDVYPILANRDGHIGHVGKFIDEARRIHGEKWPHWVFIQIFGGKDTDGGKWAQPLPHEVRCMTFIALAHRANGINYFSYWPQAPATWASVTGLNKDLETLTPWLVSEGTEVPVKTSDPAVHARARRVGDSWMVLAVNTSPKPSEMTLTVEGLPAAEFRMPFDGRIVRSVGNQIRDHVGAYQERVYLAGPEPVIAP